MRKVIELGKIDYNNTGRRNHAVDVEIELQEKDNGEKVFSARGNIWNTMHTDIVCGGQCLDEIAQYVKTPVFKEVYDLWNKYHLNDMHAGTPEQEEAIKEYTKTNRYDYTAVCEYLKSIGLYEVDLNGEPYRYGTKWLYEAIPNEDLNRIIALF